MRVKCPDLRDAEIIGRFVADIRHEIEKGRKEPILARLGEKEMKLKQKQVVLRKMHPTRLNHELLPGSVESNQRGRDMGDFLFAVRGKA